MDTVQPSSWQSFLARHNARLENGIVRDFGQPHDELRAAQHETVLADLAHFGILTAAGADAREFLNNQLTNDIAKLPAARACYAGYCSAKGRLLANFLLWQEGERFVLLTDAALREQIRKRLSMYVLRAKVKLEDAGNERVCLGLAGSQAQHIVAQIAPAPLAEMQAIAQEDLSVVRLDAARYILLLSAERAMQLWPTLAAAARPAGADVWRWLDIRAGIPWITPATQEQFVPQMANFDRFGALSYQKGCYPGQEIVARTHYLGKVKRRMHRVHSEATLKAGEELFASEGEQSCGMIVNAAPAPQGGYEALTVVQNEVTAHNLSTKSISPQSLSFLSIPYTLD